MDKYFNGGTSLGKAIYKSIKNAIKPLISNQNLNFAH